MNQSPHPSTVLRRAIARALRQARTALPGTVESYDTATCTATVQISLLEPETNEDGDKIATLLPPINNVPVYFPGRSGSRLTFGVQRGDVGVVLFSSGSLDRYLAIGGQVDPQDKRHHHVSDGISFMLGAGVDRPHTAAAHATATVLEGADVRLGDAASAQTLAVTKDVGALINILTTWTPAPGDGGLALKTAALSYLSGHPDWGVGTLNVKGS